jgi:hypothetical protein
VDITISRRPGRAVSVRLYALSRAIVRGHAVGMSVVALVALWLMRAFIFSSRLSAGTDMLGFITRAREYASGGPGTSLVRSEFSLPTSCEALAALFDDLLSTSPRERVA